MSVNGEGRLQQRDNGELHRNNGKLKLVGRSSYGDRSVHDLS